jgi:hypothetical protein
VLIGGEGKEDHAYLTDFGLTKRGGLGVPADPRGPVPGHATCAAREQMEEGKVGPRSDAGQPMRVRGRLEPKGACPLATRRLPTLPAHLRRLRRHGAGLAIHYQPSRRDTANARGNRRASPQPVRRSATQARPAGGPGRRTRTRRRRHPAPR